MDPLIVGIRFNRVGKVYHFDARNTPEIVPGDHVVVETSRGWQLGEVIQIVKEKSPASEDNLKMIDRIASPRDLVLRQMWQQKEKEVLEKAQQRARELNLKGVKVISAEYSFDGSRLTIQLAAETEEKVDFKSLRSDMQKAYAPAQVDIRQIGPRDVAKLICGLGACGLETRCCSQFLSEFSSISIRMAKEQGISLTPAEITGMCGRLRCCLNYEYDTYVACRQNLPKRNKEVQTPNGVGRVVDIIPLKEAVVVEIPEVGRKEFTRDQIEILGDAPQSAKPQTAVTNMPDSLTEKSQGNKRLYHKQDRRKR